MPDLLPRVNRPPCTGQITKRGYARIELVDSTRIDEQHRMTREQVGPPIRVGRNGRWVKTVSVEIQHRTDRSPTLNVRLDSWDVRRNPAGGRLWTRRSYVKLSINAALDLVRMFGGVGGPVEANIAEGVMALKEARHAWHLRHNAWKAEEAAKARAAAKAQLERPPEPEQPREAGVDFDDLAVLV